MLEHYRTSDSRYMVSQEPINDALSVVKQLQGVFYNDVQAFGNPRRVGVPAQATRKVLPETVEEDVTGLYYADLAALTAVLIEAVKELSAKVERLEARKARKEGS